MTTLTATRTGRLLTADGAQTTLGDHLAIHGPLSLAGDTEDASRSRFFEEIAASGLFGRGGAAFPTSRKWETMSRSRRRPVVVVNAMEGEPASSKDHVLLTRAPHLVLDGAEVAAHAVNAAEIKICVARTTPSPRRPWSAPSRNAGDPDSCDALSRCIARPVAMWPARNRPW